MAIGSSQWMYASGASDFTIPYSCKFDRASSDSLSFTPDSTTGNDRWVWSGWIKRGNIGIQGVVFDSYSDDDNFTEFLFDTDDTLWFYGKTDNTARFNTKTVAKYRDSSAWYHLVLAVDTLQDTLADRLQLYMNGVLQTLSHTTDPDETRLTFMNTSGDAMRVGARYMGGATSNFFDGYMAEVHFIDDLSFFSDESGTTNSSFNINSFGESGDYGEWKPKKYTGSYGTHGFYFDFADSAALGDDESGNTNDGTVANLTATDQMLDSPTNNFATWNALSYDGGTAMTEGNLNAYGSGGTSANEGGTATIGVTSGKWYWENRITAVGTSCAIGIFPSNNNPKSIADMFQGNPSIYYKQDGNKHINDSSSSYGDSFTTGDIIGVALNLDDDEIKFYKNNTVQNSGTAIAVTATSEYYNPVQVGTGSPQVTANFGQDSSFAGNETAQGNQDGNDIGDFYYTPPTDFLALCTSNLPAVAVVPSEHFNTILYDDGAGAKTGVGFQPDLVWLKSRGSAYEHELTDAIRGVTIALQSDASTAESTDSTGLTAFGADGFTVGADTNYADTTGDGMVAWNWKGGNATLGTGAFTQGTIASTCSRNVDAGFSIVSYTGTGSVGTVGHGLSKAPEMVIIKNRDASDAWIVYHTGLNTGTAIYYIVLNTTAGPTTSGGANDGTFNYVHPSATVFTIGTLDKVNTNTEDYIAYCFHSVDGYSKVGLYEGNNDDDGPFVYTGFRPSFLMIKDMDAVGEWNMLDSARDTYNAESDRKYLYAEAGSAEYDRTYDIDFLSNGFKVNDDQNDINAAQTYIYIAFAETPFKYSNAR